MIENYVMGYIFLYVVLEFYEVQWQKAETLLGMLARMYHYYVRNLFLFFVMHPTFYFAIWFMFYTNYNPYALMMLSFKALDIVSKIVLIKKVFIDKEISKEYTVALLTPIGPYLPYVGLVVYPLFIYLALQIG